MLVLSPNLNRKQPPHRYTEDEQRHWEHSTSQSQAEGVVMFLLILWDIFEEKAFLCWVVLPFVFLVVMVNSYQV